MARKVRHLVEAPRACSYLPAELAQLETMVLLDVAPRELEAMLMRGWRRFGPFYFRPRCGACSECVSIRVSTADFRPSRSQRRALAANRDLRIEIGVPKVDDERLDLYARWHQMREDTKGWEPSPHDAQSYALHFAFPHPCAREIAFYDGDELVGLGLSDETEHAWSLVFFFYDPAYQKRSLGVANVVHQIEEAKRRGIPHAYLGYRVLGCRSMIYKASYGPHELLVGRPDFGAPPDWKSADEAR